MKTTRLVWGLVVVLSAISSCRKEQDVFGPSVDVHGGSGRGTVDLLVFQSKDQLEEAIRNGKKSDSQGRALGYSLDGKLAPGLRSLGAGDVKVSYEDLVPEKNLRDLLNAQGEIQVGDSVYCVTPVGTFFAHRNKLNELRQAIVSFNPDRATRVNDYTLQIGAVKLYETFADVEFEDAIDSVVTEDEDEKSTARAISPTTGLDESIPMPDLESFPKERGRRITWAGKILQSISFRKSHVAQLPDNNRRRLNCAVYDFNYGFYHSIGITAKVQKKMWYGGWGKVKYWSAGTILVGYRYALVRYPYPQGMGGQVKQILESSWKNREGFKQEDRSNYMEFVPRPAWFKKQLFNSTVPLYAPKGVNLTFEDVLREAKPMIHSLIASQIKSHWGSNQAVLYEDFKQKLNGEQLAEYIDFLKRTEFIPAQVPIYAKDGIYVLYKGGWKPNEHDQSEIDIVLDQGMGTFFLRYTSENGKPSFSGFNGSANVRADWSRFVPIVGGASAGVGSLQLEYQDSGKAGTLVGGDFFAIAYGGGWVGYNLTW